jgi:inner membrane protein YidH
VTVASRPPGSAQLPSTRPAHEPAANAAGRDHSNEPDARFTLANERTFLAWNRTALALVVAGLAIAQLLPPFPGIPFGRHLLAVPLIALGAIIAIAGYLEWRRDQHALRHGQPLPRSPLPRILAGSIAAMAIVAAVLVLLSAVLK